MIDQIKQIMRGTEEASAPCTFLFGSVISESPLQVQIDNRFIVDEAALVRLKGQTEGEYNTHTHDVVVGGVTYTTKKTAENHYGLKTGDKLALLRERGGQRFLILGVIE